MATKIRNSEIQMSTNCLDRDHQRSLKMREEKKLRHGLDMNIQYHKDVTVPRKYRFTSVSIKFNRPVLKFKWKNKW